MSTLSEALSDPQTMQQVNSLLSSLSGDSGKTSDAGALPLNDTQDTVLPQSAVSPPSVQPERETGGVGMDKLVKLFGIMQQGGSDDGSVGLILALKPLLKPETRPKADRVIKLMRLMSAYPLIKDSGVLDDLF